MRTSTRSRNSPLPTAFWLLLSGLLLAPWVARGGGPLLVGGPGFGVEGQPFIWDPAAMPVQYRTDGGPLSRRPDGTVVIGNPAGVARVQAMFRVWQDVPTASISFNNAGPILSVGAFTDGDVSTVEEFNAVVGSCDDGVQSPIIFDADGNLFQQLIGDPGVIGFSGSCNLNFSTGYIVSALVAMNGQFQDGIDTPSSYPPNLELTAAEFDESFVHEFGHLAGLDHSQINVEVLNQPWGQCSATDLAGLPLMFPFAQCQARSTAGLPMLAPDDVAWISRLYPETVNSPPTHVPFSTRYGTIRGTILFSDGVTHVQGVNVIARNTTNPRGVAVSVVSGYLFTGNPGQSLTGTNDGGSPFGSRQPLLVGTYDIPVPPGGYTVEVESISEWFSGGSSVGPLSPPIPSPGPKEFWNVNESAIDSTSDKNTVTVTAGSVVNEINIILNGTAPRFDSFESAHLWRREPVLAWPRKEDLIFPAVAI
ncbi:MAG: hypothetical protein ABSA70_03750 [Terriglobia bacterium]